MSLPGNSFSRKFQAVGGGIALGWIVSAAWAILDLNVRSLPESVRNFILQSNLQGITWPLSSFWRYYASNWPSQTPRPAIEQVTSFAICSILNSMLYGFIVYLIIFLKQEFFSRPK
jgi:hypothetical protein